MDVASPSYLLSFTQIVKHNGFYYIGMNRKDRTKIGEMYLSQFLYITKLLHLTLRKPQ
jgi:hypothetical protein